MGRLNPAPNRVIYRATNASLKPDKWAGASAPGARFVTQPRQPARAVGRFSARASRDPNLLSANQAPQSLDLPPLAPEGQPASGGLQASRRAMASPIELEFDCANSIENLSRFSSGFGHAIGITRFQVVPQECLLARHFGRATNLASRCEELAPQARSARPRQTLDSQTN